MGTDEQDVTDITNRRIADQALLLQSSNDARCEAMEEATGAPGSTENVFDALKMIVLLEHVAVALDVRDQAALDFEGRREIVVGKLEARLAEMQQARADAEKLANITGPNREQRRHPPGGGIIRPH